MGIIQKQSIRGSVVSYIGVLLGFVTTGLLLPNWFSLEENGVIKLLAANTAIFAQLANLGFASVTSRMFTYFRDKSTAHHGFLRIGIVVTITGIVLVFALYYLLRDWLLIGKDESDSLMLGRYIDIVLPMVVVTAFFNLFDSYYRVLYDAVIGTLYKEVYQRAFILVAILLFFYDVVGFTGFVWLYALAHAMPTLMLFVSLVRDGEFSMRADPAFLSKDMVRNLCSVGFYGIIAGFSNMAILNIDSIMVNKYLGLSETGIYGITFFFGTLVIIPARMVKKISATILADAWKDGDMKTVMSIYKKTSINQLIIGSLILIGIWGNIDNIFQILPEKFADGRYVILLIAFSNLLEMAAGASASILWISPHYRYMTYFMLLLLVFIVLTNMVFIPLFGLWGAAFASLLSYSVFVLLRFLILKLKYNMQPFNFNHIKIVLIALLTFGLQLLLPPLEHFVLDIVVRSGFMSAVFVLACLRFKVSEDLNNYIVSIIQKIRNSR